MASIFDYFRGKKEEPVTQNEERSVTLAGPIVTDWDSSFGYGKNVDKLSIVYGCVNLLASTIASLPIQLNKKLERGYEPAKLHPYYNLITSRPNNFQTTYVFWHWVITQLQMFGNAYVQKIRNNLGEVIELYPINPHSVQVYMREDGMPYYKMQLTQPDGKSFYREFQYEELIHFRGYSRNGLYGMSPIDTFRTLFDGYNELEQAGTQIAKNAAKPNGVVYYPQNMGEDALEKMKGSWKQGFINGNSGKTAFLPNTIKVDSPNIGLTAQQAEFINQKEFSAARIASDIFRVPLHMVGLSSAPTFASVEQAAIEFLNYTISPIVTNLEQQLQQQLLDDSEEVYVNFNVTGLLRGDVKTRIEFYKFGIEHGILTPNDIHEAEATGVVIPEEKGGNDYIRPLNFSVVGKVPMAPVVQTIPPLSNNEVSGSVLSTT